MAGHDRAMPEGMSQRKGTPQRILAMTMTVTDDPRVLLVSPSQDVHELAARALDGIGILKMHAEAGQALASLEQDPVELLLWDLVLPELMDGHLFERLRRERRFEDCLLLAYTCQTRLSANIVASQTKAFVAGKKPVVAALERMKELTTEMKTALLTGDLPQFGKLLHTAWTEKKRLDSKISTTRIDNLYRIARRKGAIGGKILGAGGGGYLLLYVPFTKKHNVTRVLTEAGAEVVPFSFTEGGLGAWSVAG